MVTAHYWGVIPAVGNSRLQSQRGAATRPAELCGRFGLGQENSSLWILDASRLDDRKPYQDCEEEKKKVLVSGHVES